MRKLIKEEKFRVTDEDGVIRDIIIPNIDDIGLFKEGFSCIINLEKVINRKGIENSILSKCRFTDDFLKKYKIEPLLEKPNFVKLQDLYSLFENAKEVFLIATLTVYADSSYFNSIEKDYSFNIVYLRIDNLFTEIILSSRDDILNQNWGIDYVYIFQSEFQEDLSLDSFTNPMLHKKKLFNKKIKVNPLSEYVLESYLNFNGISPFNCDDYIGIDLEELVIYSFLSSNNNLTWGSGVLLHNEIKTRTLSLTL